MRLGTILADRILPPILVELNLDGGQYILERDGISTGRFKSAGEAIRYLKSIYGDDFIVSRAPGGTFW
jgi:hypothetical protein